MPTTFKTGETQADFAERNIGRSFVDESYGGRMRPNESLLATIERTVDWMLWKRSMIDSHGTCMIGVGSGSFRRDDKIEWIGEFAVMKEHKKVGSGSFSATFDPKMSNRLVLQEVRAKVYADQRERIERACAGP
jgi:hypothetical protein